MKKGIYLQCEGELPFALFFFVTAPLLAGRPKMRIMRIMNNMQLHNRHHHLSYAV